ncbi:unnamed protein product [Ectocarpus sp. CCAP 1310/34]|nr:unnamed protein product [Ectocarpus sp. CCAP 1310/34]
MATKAAMDMGASFEPGKLLPSGKKSYTAAAVLAVIQERAQAEGGDQSTASRRKSRHCVPRLCEVIARPENRARWAEHRTQLTKQELDAKVTGRTRQVLLDVWNQFKDKGLQVPSTFADDDRVMAAGIDPNVVHQPDISYDKFMTMKNDLVKDHGDMYGNFKKSGSMGEMYEFCKGRLDTYYYGLMVTQYPEIEQATTQMLPDGTERENTGVGGAAGGEGGPDAAAADARRRTEAKAGAKERSVDLSKEKKKKQKQEKDIEHVTRVAMTAAKDTLGLGAGIGSLLDMSSGPSGLKFDDAPTSFFDTIEGCDTKAKKLELSSLLRKELQDIKASIRKEKALGSEADPEDLELMELEANRVRVALRKQLAEAL